MVERNPSCDARLSERERTLILAILATVPSFRAWCSATRDVRNRDVVIPANGKPIFAGIYYGAVLDSNQ
jgi:hypothetical protein